MAKKQHFEIVDGRQMARRTNGRTTDALPWHKLIRCVVPDELINIHTCSLRYLQLSLENPNHLPSLLASPHTEPPIATTCRAARHRDGGRVRTGGLMYLIDKRISPDFIDLHQYIGPPV